MKKQEYSLGLNISTNSIGWGIIDKNNNIIDAGVRLFTEALKDANEVRRNNRAARRLLRRRAFRAERVKRLLLEYKIIDSMDYDFYTNETTPYHLRAKGLREELTNRELAIALLHLIKRRGIHNVEAEDKVDEKKGEYSTKNIITENSNLLQDKYICELQLERLQNSKIDLNNGAIRGVYNRFKTSDYEAEARRILEIQNNYNKKIDENFVEKYITILKGRREYYDGPGEPSQYGWKDEIEWMEKLMGMCTYYPDEIRIIKNSYTAELFNLLNDLNNLKLAREENTKLTRDEKEKIIELFKKNKAVSLKKIAAAIGIREEDISGYRIDPKEKPLFTEMKSFNNINKIIEKDDRDLYDEISKIATYYQTSIDKENKLIELFQERNISINEEKVKQLAELNYTGTHSLSKKAINEIIDDLLETTKNQMELFTERGLVPYKMDFKGKRNIPKKYVDEWILSPTVKRSMGQTINIVNALMKKYGNPKEIVIELAREKNSDEKKKMIQKMQKKNKEVNDKLKETYNLKNNKNNLLEKLKYWESQDGLCMYSLEPIRIEELLANPFSFEINYILPRSISFDGSQSNKVLVKTGESNKKGNKTPYEYLKSGKGKISYEEYKVVIEKMKNIDWKKKQNLLFEGELLKYTKSFIGNNLEDKRYATRELLNMLKKFYKDNEVNVKVKSVNSSFVNQIKKQWDIIDNSEISYNNYAQKALILVMGEKIVNNLSWVQEYNEELYDASTGAILSEEEYKELFSDDYKKRVIRYNNYRYSHSVDKKPNRQLSKETIYSTRKFKEIEVNGKEIEEVENEYYIGKLGNLYDEKNSDIKEYFENEKKKSQLLIYYHDPKTLEKFEKIYEEYKNEKNPFAAYKKEHGFITKYSKKENGPIVKELKYRVKKIGNCLDLSYKYNVKDKKRVAMLSIPSYRVDFYKKGEMYKFVSVTYLMIKEKRDFYEIEPNKYEEAKCKKNIDENYEYMFSLYKGDCIEIKIEGEMGEKLKYKGVGSDTVLEFDLVDKNYKNYVSALKELNEKSKKSDVFEITRKLNEITSKKHNIVNSKDILSDLINKNKTERKMVTIGAKVKYLRKIYVDILGNEYDSKENFKQIIPKYS